jgi:polysaccharide export outer membrane protein
VNRLFVLPGSIRNWSATFLCLFSVFVGSVAVADSSYLINAGDNLRIDVWQEENLRAEVMVSPDGTFSFPIVGTIPAAGKTIDQLQTLLRERLEVYIPGPEVTVSLMTVEGNTIFVIGEVARPGPYMMIKDLDVMQALSMAGGLTPYAAKNDVHILRKDSSGQPLSIKFRYGDVEDGDNLEANIRLQSGDTIIVP